MKLIWTLLILFEPVWSIWSDLILFECIWSCLILFEPIQNILYQSIPIKTFWATTSSQFEFYDDWKKRSMYVHKLGIKNWLLKRKLCMYGIRKCLGQKKTSDRIINAWHNNKKGLTWKRKWWNNVITSCFRDI